MSYSISSIAPLCRQFHASGLKLVLVTGFFDLLHKEHRRFLTKAKAVGDILIVGVESDARARAVKGKGRPIQSQSLRLSHLTPYTDYLVALPDDFDSPDTHESLIRAVKPNVLAISSHTAHQEEKKQLVKKYGGRLVVVHPHNPATSTTKILKQNQL